MSKSIGNTFNLEDIIKSYGADIFRMWVVCSDFTQDLKISQKIFNQLEEMYKKLRNTLRYMLGALAGYNSELEKVQYKDLHDLEKWILHRITVIQSELFDSMSSYNLSQYFNIVYNFCAGDLSSFYFDIRKDCLYCDGRDNLKRKGYRMVINILFNYITRWLAPVMVYTTEDAWLNYFEKKDSIHLQEFLVPPLEWKNESLNISMENVKIVRKVINAALENARKNKLIGSSLQAKVKLSASNSLLYNRNATFWEEIAIASQFEFCRDEDLINAFVLSEYPNIKVVISLAEGEKCERCWKISKLNDNKVCDRCQKVMEQNI